MFTVYLVMVPPVGGLNEISIVVAALPFCLRFVGGGNIVLYTVSGGLTNEMDCV